jgi:hypothetical protein
MCHILHKVTNQLALLHAEFIIFPQTAAQRLETMQQFYEIARFPGVLGALDCTHVPIQSVGGDRGELYRNRKGFFSINVQAICDAKLRITNIIARWPGSVQYLVIVGSTHASKRVRLAPAFFSEMQDIPANASY